MTARLFFKLVICLLPSAQLAASAPEPRLVVTRVGLHFICTGDGQPDMYSWRIPMKSMAPDATEADYFIPEIPDSELANYVDYFANNADVPNVSGGRTALMLNEFFVNQFRVDSSPIVELFNADLNITNLNEVHWAGQAAATIKKRFYSNFPPLNDYAGGGLYNTINLPPILSGIGSQNYPRRPNRHPGYDPANWNHTLEQDTPLAVHEKRIQAMLYLELYLPPLAELEGSLDFTLVSSLRRT